MRDTEILIDFFQAQLKGINNEVGELSEAALRWQPDAEGNSIGTTVWHVARVADFVLTHRIEGRPIEEQRWFGNGWAEKTGYDPRGIGAGGMGILTGYSQAEVAAVPAQPLADLLAYHNEVYEALLAHVAGLPEGGLDAAVPGEGNPRTVYFWCRVILLDATRHLGEIQALKAMGERLGDGLAKAS